jgi:hypothetical protein
MFTQSQFFKALSLSAFYFIAQTALAIAPHKIGVQIAESSDTYSDAFWTGFGVTCIAIVAGVAFFIVQGEKSTRYDQ